MKLAFVGCGFAANLYINTLRNYSDLELIGVYDRDEWAQKRFSLCYSVPTYDSIESLVSDKNVDIVVNLTDPPNHYSVTKQALLNGKHVYSEKPLAMSILECKELIDIAKQKHLKLSSAPCNVLGESAQTIWKTLRTNKLGKVRLIYANLDTGLFHKINYHAIRARSGAPWPYKSEFEMGCLLEHLGYYITWLVAFFGPAKKITSFSSVLIKDKETEVPLDKTGPDFGVACIEFADDIVCRLTCSYVAPRDHSITIFGDDKILWTKDCWVFGSPVYIKSRGRFKISHRVPLVRKTKYFFRFFGHSIDFARGINDLAFALKTKQNPRLSDDFCLHVNEILLAINDPRTHGTTYIPTTECGPVKPMEWAK